MMKRIGPGHFLKFTQSRELNSTVQQHTSLVADFHLDKAKKLFRKNLLAHYGCVNAIEFSNDGKLLASAGDDRRVLLWDVHKTMHGESGPINTMQAEHRSNAFVVAFDSKNAKLLSGGNDDQVIVHDVETTKPLDYFLHEEPVYGISIDPLNDNVFATACDNGELLIYDIRDPPSSAPFCLANTSSAFHAVMFNPVEPRLIVSANIKTGIATWDVRMPKLALLNYGGKNSEQCCMNARFSQDGSKILALRRRLPPILYSTDSTNHLFQFNHSGYYNSCTMKSCSFAGTDDQYVISGSDNFDLYMWKIPTEIPEPSSDARLVQSAQLVLRGHRSIVNQVRYNSRYSIIASSGVEKVIKFWSPFPLPSAHSKSTFEERSDYERRIYTNNDYINLILQSGQFLSLTYDTSRRNTREDPRMLAFFDALVQRDIEGMSDDEDEFHLLNDHPDSPAANVTRWTQDTVMPIHNSDNSHMSRSENIYLDSSDDDDESPNPTQPNEEDNDSSLVGTPIAPSEPQLVGSDIETRNQADTDLGCKASLNSQKTTSTSQGSSSRDEEEQQASQSPETATISSENNVITQLIARKHAQLTRMARNHMKLELEGKAKVKRKHMSLLERLKRLNRKTHSLTMNLLPFPGPPSSSYDSAASISESHSVRNSSTSSSSTSSSSSSSSSSDSEDDFFKLRDTIEPKLLNQSSATIQPQEATSDESDVDNDSVRASRQRTESIVRRNRWKRLDAEMRRRPSPTPEVECATEEEKPCTSATAMKRQSGSTSLTNQTSATHQSSSSLSENSEELEQQADFITRLEEVSKRLKRVTDGLNSFTTHGTNRYNGRRKQQSTMIRSPMSSSLSSSTNSSSSTTTSSSDSDESLLNKLPQPAKRRRLDNESHTSDNSKVQNGQNHSELPVEVDVENEECLPSPSEKIKKRVKRTSTAYRKRKEGSEVESD